MFKKRSAFLKIVVFTLIFLVFVFFLRLVFLYEFVDKENEIMSNLIERKEGIYMNDIYHEVGKYKIGEIQIPVIGLEPSSAYDAICFKVENNCYLINGINLKQQEIYLFNDSGFNQENDFFSIFTQEEQKFYSMNELESLPEEQRGILLDLKENPRFIFE